VETAAEMKQRMNNLIDVSQRVYALRHLETGEYICLRQDAREYLACFTDGDSAIQFREELGLVEHVDIAPMRIGEAPFDNFWLNGEMIGRAVLTDSAARRV
jgi:CRP-like cAMP-binding protein